MHVSSPVLTCLIACLLRSEDNLGELVFSTVCVSGIEVNSPLPAEPSHASFPCLQMVALGIL